MQRGGGDRVWVQVWKAPFYHVAPLLVLLSLARSSGGLFGSMRSDGRHCCLRDRQVKQLTWGLERGDAEFSCGPPLHCDVVFASCSMASARVP